MGNEINHNFDISRRSGWNNCGGGLRPNGGIPDRCVDARVIAKIFNVRTFVFLNFMREFPYQYEDTS